MDVKLQPGDYYIRSVSTGQFIGRNPNEDKSLTPKQILQLPDEIDPQVVSVRS